MASAKCGSVPSGVEYGKGYLLPRMSPPEPTRGSGEHCELPQRGPGHSPRQRILNATKCSFLYLYDKI